MKRSVLWFWGLAMLVPVTGAEFLGSLTEQERASIGVEKLTDAEKAQLESLVQRFRQNVAAESPRTLASEKEKAKEASPPARKVRLRLGTEIEYESETTQVVGRFSGWERGTLFVLANGQRWRVIDREGYSTRPREGIEAVLKPGVLGAVFLEFPELGRRVKVELVAGEK